MDSKIKDERYSNVLNIDDGIGSFELDVYVTEKTNILSIAIDSNEDSTEGEVYFSVENEAKLRELLNKRFESNSR